MVIYVHINGPFLAITLSDQVQVVGADRVRERNRREREAPGEDEVGLGVVVADLVRLAARDEHHVAGDHGQVLALEVHDACAASQSILI